MTTFSSDLCLRASLAADPSPPPIMKTVLGLHIVGLILQFIVYMVLEYIVYLTGKTKWVLNYKFMKENSLGVA